jgi:hypothetical protein
MDCDNPRGWANTGVGDSEGLSLPPASALLGSSWTARAAGGERWESDVTPVPRTPIAIPCRKSTTTSDKMVADGPQGARVHAETSLGLVVGTSFPLRRWLRVEVVQTA